MTSGLQVKKPKAYLYAIYALVVAVAFISIFAMIPTRQVSAVQPGSHTTNKNSHRSRCDANGHPYVDFSLKIKDINLNVNNGEVTYKTEVKYQKCRNDTRAYSIYGQKFCEEIGPYGEPGNGSVRAYDCVKYLGYPEYEPPGTQLACGPNLPRYRNDGCLISRADAEAKEFLVFKNQPEPGGAKTVNVTVEDKLNVPNWDNKKQISDSHTFNNFGTICQYYKFGSSWNDSTKDGPDEQRRCIGDADITVRWTAEWSVAASTSMTVNEIARGNGAGNPHTVYVGDTVRWNHTLVNNGPEKTGADVTWNINQLTGSSSESIFSRVWESGRPIGASINSSSVSATTYIPQPSDAGKLICQQNTASPASNANTGAISSEQRCVRVSYFRMKAILDDVTPHFVKQPASAVSGKVEWVGALEGDHPVKLSAYKFTNSSVLTSGQLDARASSSNEPCDIAAVKAVSGYETCKETTTTLPQISPSSINPTPIGAAFDTFDFDDDHPVGTTYCFILSVKDPTERPDDNNKWYHSTVKCTVSGLKPKVQVWGGDVKASEAIQTTFNDLTSSNRRYGSWGEYNVFSGGKNYAMSSGAGLASSAATVGSPQWAWSNLTFANTSPSGYGYFSAAELATPPTSQTGAKVRNGDLTVTSIDNLVSQMMPGNTLGSLIADRDARQTFVINGQLRINGDLSYPATVSSVRHLPRITVIVRDGVVVGESEEGELVTRIDVGIETPKLSTCSWVRDGTNYFVPLSRSSLLRSGVCELQLRFNGPVNANELYLYRTYEDMAGGAAETFNLRADNILSSYVGGGVDSPVATTNSVTELPPRF